MGEIMKRIIFSCISLLLLIVHCSYSQIPDIINFQGILKYSDGSPVSDGNNYAGNENTLTILQNFIVGLMFIKDG